MPEEIKEISQVNRIVRSGPITFGEVTYRPESSLGPRVQADFQLVVLHAGWLVVTVDDTPHELPPQHGILLGPGHREHFSFASHQPSKHSWCAVEQFAIPEWAQRSGREFGRPFPVTIALHRLIELGLSHGRSTPTSEDDPIILHLGLATIHAAAAAASHRPGRQLQTDIVIERVETFVAENYHDSLRLADLARAGGVSRQHLLKIFRGRSMPTPTNFLFDHRLNVAADYLCHTGLRISEIAQRCGFANPYHFSRKFREKYRLSPMAFRQQGWKG